MGIGFSHCNANWSYGGFMRFREKLLKHSGLSPLIFHSDCDGELTPEECKQIIPALREVIKDWPEEDFDRQQAELLIAGMEQAIYHCSNLEFI